MGPKSLGKKPTGPPMDVGCSPAGGARARPDRAQPSKDGWRAGVNVTYLVGAQVLAIRSRWRVYLRLGRVSNLPTVWTNCLAGVLLAGAIPEPSTFTLLLLSMCLFYVSGMFLNDAFDQDFDRRYRPERPIPAGEISGGVVYAIGFSLMISALALLFALTLEAFVWGTLLALTIVYYDYRHKKDPASPLVMALCRVWVYCCAASAAAGSALSENVAGGALVLMAYMIGLTYVAKQENLSEVKNLWPLLFLVAPFVYTLPVLLRFDVVSLIYLVFLAWVLYALSHLVRERKNIPVAVVSLIAGISLLDSLLIAGSWSWVAIVGFVLTLFFQRFVPGT